MLTQYRTAQTRPPHLHGVTRRELLTAGLTAGVALSAKPLYAPPALWGADAGQPKRGGILRVRGSDRRVARRDCSRPAP
jgi:hypothetical protein